MALLEDNPSSASCQFFICYSDQPSWDGRYTIFGELADEESLATLDQIMNIPIDGEGRPIKTLYIRSARAVAKPADETFRSYP